MPTTDTASPAGPFAEALAQIRGFRSLAPDWDSYGAAAINAESIAAAELLLQRVEAVFGTEFGDLLPPYFVAPVPTGGVQIEWQRGTTYFELELSAAGTLSYLGIAGKGGGRFGKVVSEGEALVQLGYWLEYQRRR